MRSTLARGIRGVFVREKILLFPECSPWWRFYRIVAAFFVALIVLNYAGVISASTVEGWAVAASWLLLTVSIVDHYKHRPQTTKKVDAHRSQLRLTGALVLLALAAVAALLKAYGGAALLVAVAGNFLVEPGSRRLAAGPTLLGNMGRALIVLGLAGFVFAALRIGT